MADKYEPTSEWFKNAWEKISKYKTERGEKNYVHADVLRKELIDMGFSDLDTSPRWHPVLESVESRSKRLEHL